MNSRLYTKKAVFAFVGVIALLLVGCALLNIFLIRPAIINNEYVPHVDTGGEQESDPFLGANKTEEGLIYYLLTTDDGIIYANIVSYQGKNLNIVIPSEIEGYTVMVIDETCFMYNEEIESVEIPNSVTTIGAWAFAGCRNLKKVSIPESVTEIGFQITLDSKKIVVYGFENSYAQQYCEENGIPFRAE